MNKPCKATPPNTTAGVVLNKGIGINQITFMETKGYAEPFRTHDKLFAEETKNSFKKH